MDDGHRNDKKEWKDILETSKPLLGFQITNQRGKQQDRES